MKKSIIFGMKNRSTFLLISILIVSTLMGTIIQFIKGDLFQGALDQNLDKVSTYILIFGVLILIEVLFYFLEWKYENHLIRNTFAKLKNSIINNVLKTRDFSNIKVKNEHHLNALTNVVDSLEYQYYRSSFDAIYLTLRIVFVTTSLLIINIYIGLVVIAFMFLPLLVTKLFKDKLANLEKSFLNQKGDNLSFFKNLLDNLKYVRILNADALFRNRSRNEINKERDAGLKTENYRITLNTMYSLLSYSSHFLILAISVLLIIKGHITPGVTITLLGLVEQLSMPILSLSRSINNINSTKKLREDINSIICVETDNLETAISYDNAITTKKLSFKFDNTVFNYNDVTFQKNNTHIITGQSGLGKSIFLESILGLLKSNHTGEICYDNNSLKVDSNPFKDIMYVMTDNNLFDGSPIFNILLRDEYSEEELNYMKKFLSEEKLLSEDVTKLSSGEKRRLLILRGLMSDKSTLIFDEPTSNLDSFNSQIFWDELLNIKDKTIIVVSHNTPEDIYDKFDIKYDFTNYVDKESVAYV
ncbi:MULTISPECIES: ATP-binding cassette domain-containing protein [Lysinibacillus]|uniref:ABC transporter ATP-binding protein n=1 Tax=Lysinibacillus tabacifolii TaxID=1173107 RepID=A0ABY2SUU6_9BACI|nr:ABC transporter ATP-binding protein [Lysinibacillus tabacifolii]TKI46632.1 ABC transporter ATP-binding protein [Lysinibacillus tabacifolii]